MSVQPVNQCLDRGLVQVTQVRCCLPGLLAHDDGLGLDESEGVDDNFTLDGLDGVNNNGNSTGRQLLERLLGVDIYGGEPASKTGVGVIPADNAFWSV